MLFWKVQHDGNDLVKNELFTTAELRRRNDCLYMIDHDVVEPVQVSKRRTFWNFGCRFEIKDDEN